MGWLKEKKINSTTSFMHDKIHVYFHYNKINDFLSIRSKGWFTMTHSVNVVFNVEIHFTFICVVLDFCRQVSASSIISNIFLEKHCHATQCKALSQCSELALDHSASSSLHCTSWWTVYSKTTIIFLKTFHKMFHTLVHLE